MKKFLDYMLCSAVKYHKYLAGETYMTAVDKKKKCRKVKKERLTGGTGWK
jgi:hypothetical protein